MADVLDSCWYVDTPIEQARQWAIERHIAGGRDADDAMLHYERNDLPNARRQATGGHTTRSVQNKQK